MPKAPILALILAVGASPMAVAAVAADEVVTATATVKKPKPKKICKTSDKITGSRIAKRTCKTEEEWAEAASDQELQVKSQN